MPGQHLLKHSYWPLLKVVVCCHIYGAAKCIVRRVPCLLPYKLLLIYQYSEHLQDRYCTVKFVEQYLVFFVKFVHLVHDIFFESPHQVLQSGSCIEVLLLKSLFLVLLLGDVWIIDGG